MKGKLIREKETQFKPFIIKLNVESLEEARLLFHVFNDSELYDSINHGGHYPIASYNAEIAENLKSDMIAGIIGHEIIDQGFEV